ncbi:hypothetical protein G3545_02490 [Starkeya sp. ORNL1]|uniref:hypothetical protein n=1 Tax=Starkeya sp. ORNL1 TaxID=2709380 RepID=UPI0014634BE9|nr:hypothetical protein [Starkeya sp. ORNL1]QJP12631.1 hypothetical protein G3545_02490 [Starkeya sp. ORNL1]
MADQQNIYQSRRVPEQLTTHATAQAALMLVESLALALVESGVLTSDKVVDAFENVVETKRRMGEESEDAMVAAKAGGLISNIVNSLRLAHSDKSTD